jgi:spermidine synthase
MLGFRILEECDSKFNGHIRVVKSWGLGTYVQADGLTQSGGIVETFWKQTLKKVHQSLTTNHQTLILGLGGGTVAKLVHKNWPEAKITGVDIDLVIVELGKKYLGLDDSFVKIIIEDASNLSNMSNLSNKNFDLIIVDLYQGDKFPPQFASKYYINHLSSLLARDGVIVFNRLFFKDNKNEALNFGEKLKKCFKKVEYFYPVTNLMLICSV